MYDIAPSITAGEIACAEIAAPATGFVVFGASGDLTTRKLIPSLMQIYQNQLLDDGFFLLGTGRKKLSQEEFRQIARKSITDSSNNTTDSHIEAFIENFYYVSGNYDEPLFYKNIKSKLDELDAKHHVNGRRVFYLAVPPFLYGAIVEQLRDSGLSCPQDSTSKGRNSLVVEKPFGRDLRSALELNEKIHRCFDESQIYRIDHYLGKETVQNILMFRFANAIFEPLWDRNYIDHIQITIAETLGVGHRGGYYDTAGALRDMFQNHILQMLALVAMEPPVSFNADNIRDEKVKLLRSIRPFKPADFIRAQYTQGTIDGKDVPGYKDESQVQPNSKTETFIAAKLFIDNPRWKDVPFYLRTGKRLKHKDTEIAITFKKVPHSMFASSGLEEMPPNVLVLQIQPEEGISLSFQAKRPGSKICMSTLNMNFSYASVFGVDMPEAYQRLLLDCMLGDQTLFTRSDDIEVTWKLLMPILQAWQNGDVALHYYHCGMESFAEADTLIGIDGKKWRKLSAI